MSDLKVLSVQKRAGLGKGANRRAVRKNSSPACSTPPRVKTCPCRCPFALSRSFSLRLAAPPCSTSRSKATARIPVLIWATQRDPITSRFTHIDFYGVDLDKPVKITVPVEFTGVARGTKVGGKLETYREQIQLMAKPLDMPAKVTIDISGMDVGTTIQIADVKLPEGVKAAYDNNYAIVSVLMPGGDDAAAE